MSVRSLACVTLDCPAAVTRHLPRPAGTCPHPVPDCAAYNLLPLMPFAATLGIELDAADAAEVRGHLAWSERLCTTGGVMHGGALMGLLRA